MNLYRLGQRGALLTPSIRTCGRWVRPNASTSLHMGRWQQSASFSSYNSNNNSSNNPNSNNTNPNYYTSNTSTDPHNASHYSIPTPSSSYYQQQSSQYQPYQSYPSTQQQQPYPYYSYYQGQQQATQSQYPYYYPQQSPTTAYPTYQTPSSSTNKQPLYLQHSHDSSKPTSFLGRIAKRVTIGLTVYAFACLIFYFVDKYYLKKDKSKTNTDDSNSALKVPFAGPSTFGAKEVVTIPTTRFEDVKGCAEAKADMQEIVQYLKNPAIFEELGGKLPKGVLLAGPPGTGKTLLARAVAGEAGVPFFSVTGSEFEEVFVGVGASRVRDLFKNARAKAPCIIFIDEIDAIGGKRSMRENSAARQSLNQLLVEMDGFQDKTGIIVMGATNVPEYLDKALIRPGRFDRVVQINLPNVHERLEILEHYAKKINMDDSVDLSLIARGTPGTSGAVLYNLINTAAIRAASKDLPKVGLFEVEWAKDKVLMGAERSSLYMNETQKQAVAYHEGGHALVGALISKPSAYPLYKATILPRGHALGITFFLPKEDELSLSQSELALRLDVAMGGRVAEELIYGENAVTTGAGGDLRMATDLAKQMVMKYGMSPKVGFYFVNTDQNESVSEEMMQLVDEEVNRLLKESYARSYKLLLDHLPQLHLLADALIKYETLDAAQIREVIDGKIPSGIFTEKFSDAPMQPRKPGSTPLVLETPTPVTPKPIRPSLSPI